MMLSEVIDERLRSCLAESTQGLSMLGSWNKSIAKHGEPEGLQAFNRLLIVTLVMQFANLEPLGTSGFASQFRVVAPNQ